MDIQEMVQKKEQELGKYQLSDYNTDVWGIIIAYFSNDPLFEGMGEHFSHSKGILLLGNIGCGKTKLMKLFTQNEKRNFKILNCRAIASDFAINGDEALLKYIQKEPNSFDRGTTPSICFDDLGTEPDKKYYGTDINVLLEIMLRRYDRGEFYRTHATTNLLPDELRSRYGERLTSRFREMFNLIKFPANAPDLRK